MVLGRRVAVTGMGLVCPLGVGIEHVWSRLIAGQSGIGKIVGFDASDLSCQIAGQLPEGSKDEGLFFADDWVERRERRKMDDFILYAIAAADMAIEDSGFKAESYEQQINSGVLVGSGIGGLQGICEGQIALNEKGPRRLTPYFIPANLINLASGLISIKHRFKGPNHSVVTACATGTHAIGDAARMIALGDADVMIAGGSEAAVCRMGIAGFCAARALSTSYNDRPEEGSRPWDKDRDGFVMGEGAGVVVLEEMEAAKARGARIYGEVIGYGMSGDAHHMTAPAEDGDGAYRSMAAAIRSAGVDLEQITYINAHGTSTPLGDVIELRAVKRLFGAHANQLSMSSTKSSIGHLLGAAGAVEAIFTLKSIQTGIMPPTLNLESPSDGCDIDLVPKQAKSRDIGVALSNSFGFGGTNASLVFSRV